MKYLGDSCLMSTRWAYIDTVTVTVSVQCALTSLHWLPHWYCAVMTVSVQCALRLCGGVCLRSVCIDTVTLTVSVQCGLILLHWLSSSVCIDTVLWWLSQFSVHWDCCHDFPFCVHWHCYIDCLSSICIDTVTLTVSVQYTLTLLHWLSQFSMHWYCAVVTVSVQCVLILCCGDCLSSVCIDTVTLTAPPKGGRGCLMSSPCLESQGCHLVPLCYLLSCSSA